MTIVDAGKAGAVQRLFDTGFNPFNYIAVGTSSMAVAAAQTALQGSEVMRQLCATGTEITYTANKATISKLFTFSGSSSIEEVGLFNAAAVGVMLGRGLTGTTAVSSGDKITFTVEITQS